MYYVKHSSYNLQLIILSQVSSILQGFLFIFYLRGTIRLHRDDSNDFVVTLYSVRA